MPGTKLVSVDEETRNRWESQYDGLSRLIEQLEAETPQRPKELIAAYTARARAIEGLAVSPWGRR